MELLLLWDGSAAGDAQINTDLSAVATVSTLTVSDATVAADLATGGPYDGIVLGASAEDGLTSDTLVTLDSGEVAAALRDFAGLVLAASSYGGFSSSVLGDMEVGLGLLNAASSETAGTLGETEVRDTPWTPGVTPATGLDWGTVGGSVEGLDVADLSLGGVIVATADAGAAVLAAAWPPLVPVRTGANDTQDPNLFSRQPAAGPRAFVAAQISTPGASDWTERTTTARDILRSITTSLLMADPADPIHLFVPDRIWMLTATETDLQRAVTTDAGTELDPEATTGNNGAAGGVSFIRDSGPGIGGEPGTAIDFSGPLVAGSVGPTSVRRQARTPERVTVDETTLVDVLDAASSATLAGYSGPGVTVGAPDAVAALTDGSWDGVGVSVPVVTPGDPAGNSLLDLGLGEEVAFVALHVLDDVGAVNTVVLELLEADSAPGDAAAPLAAVAAPAPRLLSSSAPFPLDRTSGWVSLTPAVAQTQRRAWLRVRLEGAAGTGQIASLVTQAAATSVAPASTLLRYVRSAAGAWRPLARYTREASAWSAYRRYRRTSGGSWA